MTEESEKPNQLINLYTNRIGKPATTDEVNGYWLFALGVVLGVLGVLLFLVSSPAGSLRELGTVIGAAGVVLVFAGPIIRLPLQRRATLFVYGGVVIAVLAILWFIVAFPSNWSPTSGNSSIIGLYALGLAVIAIGGVFVPLLTTDAERETRLGELEREVEALRNDLQESEADEAELADLIASLREALQNAETDRDELAARADQLRADIADAEADESDLAAQLEALRTSQAQFEVYEDNSGKWRWRLHHRNGNIIADSSQGYTQRHNAQKGMHSVRRNALGATILLVESEEELPAENEAFEPPEERESRATFELYGDRGGEHRWRLRHDNGNILGDGAEGYSSRSGARTAVDRLKHLVGPADYLEFDPTGFEVYRDRSGEFRWRLVHRNGNILADSGESYTRRNDANRAVNRIRERIGELEFDVYEDNAGEHRWRLLGGNDQIIADSGEGYDSRSGVEEAVERVQKYAPEADVLDIGQAAFEIYEDSGGEWRWRLRHRNGNILMDSGEGFGARNEALQSIHRIKRNAPAAAVEESA